MICKFPHSVSYLKRIAIISNLLNKDANLHDKRIINSSTSIKDVLLLITLQIFEFYFSNCMHKFRSFLFLHGQSVFFFFFILIVITKELEINIFLEKSTPIYHTLIHSKGSHQEYIASRFLP